jgi:hypothetical protein
MAKGAEHLERSLEYFRLEEAQLQASGDASQVYLSYFNSAISYHWLGDDPQGCTAMAKAIEAADGSDQRNPGKKVPADHRKQMQAFVKQYACDRPRASASEQPASAPAGLEGTQIENIAWTMPATGRFPAWPRRTSIRDGRLTLSEHGMTLVGTAAMRGDNTNEVSVFYSDLSQVWLSRDGTWPQIEIAYRDGRKATVSFAGEGPVQQRVMAKQVYAWLKEKLESSNSP